MTKTKVLGRCSTLWGLAVLLLLSPGCRRAPDFAEAKRQILELHRGLIAAHFAKDPDFFGRGLSPGFISVKNGEILRPTREDYLAGLRPYILETDFREYRDLAEPIIGFSRDGTLAWAAVQVKVGGVRRPAGGPPRDIDFVCAWLTLYEKAGRDWKTLAEVSTFK